MIQISEFQMVYRKIRDRLCESKCAHGRAERGAFSVRNMGYSQVTSVVHLAVWLGKGT